MSHWSDSCTGGRFSNMATLAQQGIVALQREYGINRDRRAIDTLDFPGFLGGAVMVLRQGGFSATGFATRNVWIACFADVEHAMAGPGLPPPAPIRAQNRGATTTAVPILSNC